MTNDCDVQRHQNNPAFSPRDSSFWEGGGPHPRIKGREKDPLQSRKTQFILWRPPLAACNRNDTPV